MDAEELTPQEREVVELKVQLMQCRISHRKLVDALMKIAELDGLTQGDIAVRAAERALEG